MPTPTRTATCRHCERDITRTTEGWIDPEAPATPEDGDDHIWRATCDSSPHFTAEHEPVPAPMTERLGRLPIWAGDLVERLLADHQSEAALYTATAHERVMARLDDGTVLIANRGRGLTTLTPAEARVLAAFLLGQ